MLCMLIAFPCLDVGLYKDDSSIVIRGLNGHKLNKLRKNLYFLPKNGIAGNDRK